MICRREGQLAQKSDPVSHTLHRSEVHQHLPQNTSLEETGGPTSIRPGKSFQNALRNLGSKNLARCFETCEKRACETLGTGPVYDLLPVLAGPGFRQDSVCPSTR